MPRAIACDRCGAAIGPELYNLDHLVECPGCSSEFEVAVFAAHYHSSAGSVPEAVGEAGEATCFYHPDNRAVVPCGSCGRFLCGLCDVDLGAEHICPLCIQHGIRNRKLVRLENRRVLYDGVALALAVAPMLLIWPTIITAPLTIFLSIRYWKAPASLTGRTKVRFIVAILLGVAQLAMWGFVAYAMALSRGLA